MSDPCSVVPCFDFPELILADLLKRPLVRFLIVLDRYLSCHSTHCMNLTLMTRLDQQIDVSFEKCFVHRYLGSIRQHELRSVAKLFDVGENVVPAATVQAR